MATSGNQIIIGKVVVLYGTVKAVAPDGTVRVLGPNSLVYAGERIITESDGSVSIVLNDPSAGQIDLGRMSDVLLTEDVYAGAEPDEVTDAVAQAEQVEKAVEADEDIELEATAAGGAAGTGTHEIPIFDLDANEVTPGSGAETTGFTYGTVNTLEGIVTPEEALPPEPPPPVMPTISINDVTVNESDGTITFTVTRTGQTDQASSVDYSVEPNTALMPGDYTAGMSELYGTLNFSAGETTQTITLNITGDAIYELTETFYVNLSNPVGATISDNQGIGTILDNDTPVVVVAGIEADDVTVTEGEDAVFKVSITNAADGSTVTLKLADGTAIDADYNESYFQYSTDGGATWSDVRGAISVAPGNSTLLVKTDTVDDSIDENDETFSLTATLNSLSNTYSDSATATIIDNDNPPTVSPTVSISDGTPDPAIEGTDGAITFTVTLSHAADHTLTVNYSTVDGTAVAGSDYMAKSGTLTFAAGETSKTLTITVLDDEIFENFEAFSVVLSNPSAGLTISDGQGIGTILDDDAQVSFSINDVTVHEADGTITFTVTKAGATALASSVDYTVNPNTAGTPGDYTAGTSALAGTLNFAAGVTTQTITLNITDDYVYEPTETFYVNLSNPVAANISDAQGIGTILDDDAKPAFSINDMTVNEADGTITFTVTKTGATALASSVDYTVNPNTAVTPGDYTAGTSALTGILNFAAGVTTQTITLNITDDYVYEPTETFTVDLSNAVEATISDAQGVGTILDDDAQVFFSINDVTVHEADGTITFTVTKTGATALASSVEYTVNPNTAVTPGDYAAGTSALTGTLTFAAGVTTQAITLNITDDMVYEPTETFYVNLSNPVNATISDAQGIGTILDDDSLPIATPDNDVTVFEKALDLNQDGADLAAGTVKGTDPTSTGETDSSNTLVGSVSGGAGGYTYSLVGSPNGTYGVIQINSDGTYVYTLTKPVTTTPAANDGVSTEVRESFTYQVMDSAGQTATSTISVNIVDDVPVATDSDGTILNTAGEVLPDVLSYDTGADGLGGVTLSAPTATSEGSPITLKSQGATVVWEASDANGDGVDELYGYVEDGTSPGYDAADRLVMELAPDSPDAYPEDGTYSLTLHDTVDLPADSTTISFTGITAGGPITEISVAGQMLISAVVPGTYVNASGYIGIGNNVMDAGEIVSYEFGTVSESGGDLYIADADKILVNDLKLELKDTGSGTDSFNWTAYGADGTTVVGSGSMTVPDGATESGVIHAAQDFYKIVITMTDGAFKVGGVTYTEEGDAHDVDLHFNYSVADGDGDVIDGAFDVTVTEDMMNSLLGDPDPDANS